MKHSINDSTKVYYYSDKASYCTQINNINTYCTGSHSDETVKLLYFCKEDSDNSGEYLLKDNFKPTDFVTCKASNGDDTPCNS